MAIRIVYPDDTTQDLRPEFALDDWNLSTRRAVFEAPGRVGALPIGRRYARPRALRLTGTFQGISREDAEEIAREVRGYLVGRGPIKLYRWPDATRYIVARGIQARDDPHRGRFAGRLYTLSFDLEAADPFWRASIPEQSLRSVSAVYDRWALANPGSVPYQQAKVTFTARSNGVVNPSLHNGQGGYLAAYTGTLNAGESVVLDGETRAALKGGVNVAPQVNGQWHADGFPLQPGTNWLTYQDSDLSSHACDVTVEWTPAFW